MEGTDKRVLKEYNIRKLLKIEGSAEKLAMDVED